LTAARLLTSEHLHFLGHDLQLAPLLSVLLPLIQLEPTFEQYRSTLVQILRHNFGGATPARYLDVGDFLHPLVVPLDFVVDGNAALTLPAGTYVVEGSASGYADSQPIILKVDSGVVTTTMQAALKNYFNLDRIEETIRAIRQAAKDKKTDVST